jgi:hypothetical protein
MVAALACVMAILMKKIPLPTKSEAPAPMMAGTER